MASGNVQDPIASALRGLNMQGLSPLMALTWAGFAPVETAFRPAKLICSDGNAYWVKSDVQDGLIAELVAGRIAACLGAGPDANVIFVDESLGSYLTPPAFGYAVGIQDVSNAVNARDVHTLGVPHLLGMLDGASMARVVAFQTWLGILDNQLMILPDGRVVSIDHGACFDDRSMLNPMTVRVVPGVYYGVAKNQEFLEPVISQIEAFSMDKLITAASRVPDEPRWNGSFDRCVKIVNFLDARKSQVRAVLEGWLSA